MPVPGRTYTSASYRYGFNGKENDNEVKGAGNQQDYGMRIYEPRLGRFLSEDPLTKDYPGWSPYPFAMNRPIDGIDLDGLEWQPVNLKGENGKSSSKDVTDYKWVGYNVDGSTPEGSVASGTVKWKGSTWNYNSDAKHRDGTISVHEDNGDKRFILINSDNTARSSTDGAYVGNEQWNGTQRYDVRGMRGGEMNANLQNPLRRYHPAPGNANYVPVESLLVPLPSANVILFGRVAGAGRVFWSGGWAEAGLYAQEYAAAKGLTTIEMTTTGKALIKLTNATSYTLTKPLWKFASKSFASGTTNEATIILGLRKYSSESIFNLVERPILEKNAINMTLIPR